MIIDKVCCVKCPEVKMILPSQSCKHCKWMEDYNEQTVTCKFYDGDE